ncbi:RING-H2 finger protein ATL18, partial [Trifolium medium]|nr:RING-H2 finger protein ATL18 [Trifolium medium]
MYGLTLMFFFSSEHKCAAKEMEFLEIPSLPVARFKDLGEDEDENEEEICSICLVEFEGEDA